MVGRSWYGIHGSHVVRISAVQGEYEFLSFPDLKSCERAIFRLDDDIERIISEITRDKLMSALVRQYAGLRLMRQDPEQCIFSFTCSSNTNIPMIRTMLRNLARKFGERVVVDGREFFTFPKAKKIHEATTADIRTCGLGYRAKAVKAVAESIVNGSLDLDALQKAKYEDAKEELLKVYGIGNKIADCVMLFSLEKLEAFPIDVWIARSLARHYKFLSDSEFGEKLSPLQYVSLSGAMRAYFGEYAGYAQQFLFYHMRQQAHRKW
jgi:N-glycosylase/DNA lyase